MVIQGSLDLTSENVKIRSAWRGDLGLLFFCRRGKKESIQSLDQGWEIMVYRTFPDAERRALSVASH